MGTSMTVWAIAGIIVAAVVIAWALVKAGRKVRDKTEASKVIQMSLYKPKPGQPVKSQGGSKTCSFCKKKSKRLAFYANEAGGVVGVCDDCRPQAERRALMRL
ncbi:hypothetical protein WMW72_11790 [Paenibacillus filicis]|uniref:Uncharacterized protein n=1 Tax=Paenibacillus filicis TaxID=669464 RepID=A0ABU9DI92_9BACL